MRVAVLVFPGSNCDHDAHHAINHVLGGQAEYVWHREKTLKGYDAVIVPGGFSYGDYLRTGAIARFAPVMTAVKKLADVSDETEKRGIGAGFFGSIVDRLSPH